MSFTQFSDDFEYTIDEKWELHLGKISLNTMKKYHDRTHQVNFTDDISESHGSVRLRSIRVAQALSARGVGHGDIIILCGPNHNDISIPLVASLYIGAAIYPFEENQTLDEWCNSLTLCTPNIIFCESTQTEIAKTALKQMGMDVEIVVFGENIDEGFTSFEEFLKPTDTEHSFKVTEFDPEETIAIISSTSGTSGFSKAVCLTHKQLALRFHVPLLTTDPDTYSKEVILHCETLYWISGIMNILASCFYGQNRIQTPMKFSPILAYIAIEKYKPTYAILTAPFISAVLSHSEAKNTDISSFKYVISTGSAVPADIEEKFLKLAPKAVLVNSYGVTEGAGLLTSLPNGVRKSNTCGKILPFIEWKIVNPDSYDALAPNQNGELLIKGPTLFKEYHNDPESTKRAFTDDGWFKTGDILYYDKDDYLYYVDRVKQIFKYCNYQVSPAELEFVINKLDGVMKCCVVGKSGGTTGELPLAFVEKVPGSNITAQDIKDAVKSALADWKQLRGGVVFMETLPVTYMGKIDRKVLKSMKDTVTSE